MESKLFLETLYPDLSPDDGLYLLIWNLRKPQKNNQSLWFQDTDKAAQKAVELEKNVFVGVGLSSEDRGPTKRGLEKQIAGIPALYVDLDIAHPAHKKKDRLPQTFDQAVGLIKGHGFDPTLIVDSGHGLHAYWCFKEIWTFDTPEERMTAKRFNQRLHATVKSRAAQHGWDIDSVFDLSRVLRVPGTLNCKQDAETGQYLEPIRATIFENTGNRYNPDDFDDLLMDTTQELNLPVAVQKTIPPKDKAQATKSTQDQHDQPIGLTGRSSIKESTVQTVCEQLTLDPNADPPQVKFDTFLQIDPTFLATWEMRRSNCGDGTPSAYDMALVNMAMEAEWTDQEIADLIIAFRRKHNNKPEKALNHKYIAFTLEMVRKRFDKEKAVKTIEEHSTLKGTKYEGKFSEDQREKLRKSISSQLGINILKIIIFNEEHPTVLVATDKGEVELPSVGDLLAPTSLRNYLAATTRTYMMVNKKQWPKIAQAMLDIAERKDVSPESTVKGKIESWLQDYIEDKRRLNLKEGAEARDAFLVKNRWHIFLENFHQWSKFNRSSKDSSQKLARQLTRFGCERKQFNIHVNNKRTTRKVWQLPASIK